MENKKPLSYQCSLAVLQNIWFLKRKEIFLYCPGLRKQEERLGYRFQQVKISEYGERCVIEFDRKFTIKFDVEYEYKDNGNRIEWGDSKKIIAYGSVKKTLNSELKCSEAAEKLAVYTFDRPGTIIRELVLHSSPLCILKCRPMSVINLIVGGNVKPPPAGFNSWIQTTSRIQTLETYNLFRDETMKSAREISLEIYNPESNFYDLLSEFVAGKVTIMGVFPVEQVAPYCLSLVHRRPKIGFEYNSEIMNPNLEFATLDWIASKAKGRKTFWNRRKCFTLGIDQHSELNVHGNLTQSSTKLIIEVNPKGTAIDR